MRTWQSTHNINKTYSRKEEQMDQSPKSHVEKVPILNISLHNVTMEEAVKECLRLIDEKRHAYVVPVNTDVIVKSDRDEKLRQCICEADLALADGKPLVWISRYLKTPLKERVTGSDLVPELLAECEKKGRSVFFLGGTEDAAMKAATNVKREHPGLHVAGTLTPEPGFEKDPDEIRNICTYIRTAGADLLVVCFGCPKQEYFVYDHRKECGAALTVCAGGTIDFLSGNVSRAPLWMQKAGLEWFYRFLKEPKRLFHRYFVDDMKIVGMVRKYGRKA